MPHIANPALDAKDPLLIPERNAPVAQESLSRAQCLEIFFKVLRAGKDEPSHLLHNTGSEGPYTALAIMLTLVCEASPSVQQYVPVSVLVTTTIAMHLSSLIKKELKAVGADEKKLYHKIVDFLENSTSFHNTFGNAFYSLTQGIGYFLPENLPDSTGYGIVAGILLASCAGAIISLNVLDKARDASQEDLLNYSPGRKATLLATAFFDAGSNFVGGYTIFYAAATILAPNFGALLQPSLLTTQLYGGCTYAALKAAAWLTALTHPNKFSSERIKSWDRKVENRVSALAYGMTDFAFLLPLIQAGYLFGPSLAISSKAFVTISNLAYKAAKNCRSKPEDNLSQMERGELDQDESHPHHANGGGIILDGRPEDPHQGNVFYAENLSSSSDFSDSGSDDLIFPIDGLHSTPSSNDLSSSIEELYSAEGSTSPIGYSLRQSYWARKAEPVERSTTDHATEPAILYDLDTENTYSPSAQIRSPASLVLNL
jgi:hypothetical protein